MARAHGTYKVELGASRLLSAGIMLDSHETQYHGDLEAAGRGARLCVNGDPADGWVGYAVLERVSGTLHGRSGGFVLQHSVTMRKRGTESFVEETTVVVPDSGTGELKGLAGRLSHWVGKGEHAYDFEYTLDPTP